MRALLLVDLQNDFMPGGALAVKEGDLVVPVANELVPHYPLVVATQDWHPANHESFAANHPTGSVGDVVDLHGLPQVLWPTHCVQLSPGAEFHSDLDRAAIERVFQKGMDPTVDSYSGFQDNGGRRTTGLADYLRARGVSEVHVLGLATDYCVRFTVLDALAEGFRVTLVEDGCRGVELNYGDVAGAVASVQAAGARISTSWELLRGARHRE